MEIERLMERLGKMLKEQILKEIEPYLISKEDIERKIEGIVDRYKKWIEKIVEERMPLDLLDIIERGGYIFVWDYEPHEPPYECMGEVRVKVGVQTFSPYPFFNTDYVKLKGKYKVILILKPVE